LISFSRGAKFVEAIRKMQESATIRRTLKVVEKNRIDIVDKGGKRSSASTLGQQLPEFASLPSSVLFCFSECAAGASAGS